MFILPLGLVLLLAVLFLCVSGRGETVTDALALSGRGTAVFLGALILSYLVPPLSADGIQLYWLPFLLLSVYAVFLSARLRRPLRGLLFAVLSAGSMALISLVLPVQPVGLLYEPLALYALFAALFALPAARNERDALYLSFVPLTLFHGFLFLTGRLTVFLSASFLFAVCLAGALSLPPVKFLREHRISPYRRVFQTEAANSFGKLKRKRFKK